MEKVNEIGRFKQRGITGIEYFNDWLDRDLNLNILHSYRFDYVINKEDLSMFLDYVGYLSIPELGIEKLKVKVTRDTRSSKYCKVYLTIKGQKAFANSVDSVLRDLCYGLAVKRGELNEQ